MHSTPYKVSKKPKLLTIRDPLSYYFSLWKFGLEKKGGFYLQLLKLHPDSIEKYYGVYNSDCFSWFLDYALSTPVFRPIAKRFCWVPLSCDIYSARILSFIVPKKSRNHFLSNIKADLSRSNLEPFISEFVPEILIRTDQLNDDFYKLAKQGDLDCLDLCSGWEKIFELDSKPKNTTKVRNNALNESKRQPAIEMVSNYHLQLIHHKCGLADLLIDIANQRIK